MNHSNQVLCGQHENLSLVEPGECQHVVRSSYTHHTTGVFPSSSDVFGHASPVRLECTGDCDPYLRQLSGKEWATVETVDVEIVPLMVKWGSRSHHYLGCVWEVTVKQLGLLAVVDLKAAQIPSFAVG